MRLVIYEGRESRQLYPLTEMHAAWDLHLGSDRLGRRLQQLLGESDCSFHCRRLLRQVMAEAGWPLFAGEVDSDTLFINGQTVDLPVTRLPEISAGASLLNSRGDTVAFRLAAGDSHLPEDEEGYLQPPQLPGATCDAVLIREPWDLLTCNDSALRDDFTPPMEFAELPGVIQIEQRDITVHPEAVVQPGAVLDATAGPVSIGPRTIIGSLAVIQGPVHIAGDCRIKPHSHIYDATSIGPHCRVGGEIENTICHSYVNKQHQGFVGHSLLMPWTNLGADSNTSDLKNNYSPIRVSRRGELVESGQQFLGLLLGDHSKCAINTQFNTGTVGGLFSQIFTPGFPPKELPPFSWGGGVAGSYRLEDVLEVVERVMSRRQQELTPALRQLIERLHQQATSKG